MFEDFISKLEEGIQTDPYSMRDKTASERSNGLEGGGVNR